MKKTSLATISLLNVQLCQVSTLRRNCILFTRWGKCSETIPRHYMVLLRHFITLHYANLGRTFMNQPCFGFVCRIISGDIVHMFPVLPFKPNYRLGHPKNYLFISSINIFIGSKYPTKKKIGRKLQCMLHARHEIV